jgi:hypothetical protein
MRTPLLTESIRFAGSKRDPGIQGTGGVYPASPGHCECSSFLGTGCSTTKNACNEGYVASCDCGFFGNSCQCVPGNR